MSKKHKRRSSFRFASVPDGLAVLERAIKTEANAGPFVVEIEAMLVAPTIGEAAVLGTDIVFSLDASEQCGK
jgi:hypothetical protein